MIGSALTDNLFAIISSQSNDLHVCRDGTLDIRPDAQNWAAQYVVVSWSQAILTP